MKNCDEPYHSLGYCRNHYHQFQKWGTTKSRKCIICNSNLTNNPSNPTLKRKYDRNYTTCHKCYKPFLRSLIFEKLGGKCNCCGEKEKKFLQIDHIYGGGNKHIKSTNTKGYYEDVLHDIKLFQILCANCNFGKHLNGGICPHKNN